MDAANVRVESLTSWGRGDARIHNITITWPIWNALYSISKMCDHTPFEFDRVISIGMHQRWIRFHVFGRRKWLCDHCFPDPMNFFWVVMGVFDIYADENNIRNGYINVLNQLSTVFGWKKRRWKARPVYMIMNILV